MRDQNFPVYLLAVKVLILVAILFPLMVFVARNGLSALKQVWGRVTVVAVIIVINLAMNVSMLRWWWEHVCGA